MTGLSGLHPVLRRAAVALFSVAAEAGLRPQITSTRRSVKEQARLYRDYLSGRSRYPAAPPGRSSHARGLAFDMTVTPRSALTELGQLWERIGGTWGGRFRDPIHFEIRPRRYPRRRR